MNTVGEVTVVMVVVVVVLAIGGVVAVDIVKSANNNSLGTLTRGRCISEWIRKI